MSGALCVIPARGGSVRIPRKNIREFRGKPMLAYAIEAARASGLFSEIVVSTDDAEISRVAEALGAVSLARPGRLALNEVGTQEVMKHCVETLKVRPDRIVCCLYPCVPLLTRWDLQSAYTSMADEGGYAVAVGAEPLRDIGWFYFGVANWFSERRPLYDKETRLHVVNEPRAIDINTEDDWSRALNVAEQRGSQ